MYKFKNMPLLEVDSEIKKTAFSLNKEVKNCSLEYLFNLNQYGLKGDKEHDYKNFLKGYEIDKDQYLLLFGKKDIVDDWKWLGYSEDNLADKIISVMYEIKSDKETK
jgi:hypothetical protein